MEFFKVNKKESHLRPEEKKVDLKTTKSKQKLKNVDYLDIVKNIMSSPDDQGGFDKNKREKA